MTRCCDGPFGAVRPLDAPSWLKAEPRTTASTGCPAATASESRSTTRMPTPSDQPVPSADSENALHRPSGASPPCREKPEKLRRRRHHGDATGQRERALATTQRLRRQVQRHQRRRAGRVDRDRGTLQSQRVGDATGDHRRRETGAGVAFQVFVGGHDHVLVVLPVGADEHTGPRAAQRRRVDAGAFDASQDVSSSSRCCGSIASASRGEMPKNAGSKSATPVRKPPRNVELCNDARSQPRSVGEARHRVLARDEQPPQVLGRVDAAGKWHAMPTIAMSSVVCTTDTSSTIGALAEHRRRAGARPARAATGSRTPGRRAARGR